ncbi:WD40 repeat domain-containing protein, partial [bacterium]
MSGASGRIVAGPETAFDDYPVDLAWLSPQRLAVGGGEGRLATIDAGTGELTMLGEHAPGLLRLVPLAGGAIVTTGQDGSVRRWSADGAQQTLHRGVSWVEALAVSHDGAKFAFAAGKSTQVHDTSGALIRKFDPLPRAPSLAAWRGRFSEVALAAGTQAWLRRARLRRT